MNSGELLDRSTLDWEAYPIVPFRTLVRIPETWRDPVHQLSTRLYGLLLEQESAATEGYGTRAFLALLAELEVLAKLAPESPASRVFEHVRKAAERKLGVSYEPPPLPEFWTERSIESPFPLRLPLLVDIQDRSGLELLGSGAALLEAALGLAEAPPKSRVAAALANDSSWLRLRCQALADEVAESSELAYLTELLDDGLEEVEQALRGRACEADP